MDIQAFLRIAIALAVYFAVALVSTVVSRRLGANLKTMEGRASGVVQAIGIVANTVVLGLVLALLIFVDKRHPTAIGLRFDLRDLGFLLTAVIATFTMAVGFVGIIARVQPIRIHQSKIEQKKLPLLGVAAALLLVVSLQEEVLFRGYIGLNLSPTSPWVVLIVTSVIFAVIHFPTNAVSLWQAIGWLAGGFLLGACYLLSGSIWIAVGIHLATDFLNVLVFNVAGRVSMYKFEPPLTSAHRTLFRLFQGVVTIGLLLLFYGHGLQIIA